MNQTFGERGEGVRCDASIEVRPSPTLRIEVSSTIDAIYGDSIREQAQRVLSEFGNPALEVFIEDTGALPFVIEARLEAALHSAIGVPLPKLSALHHAPIRNRPRRSRLYVPGSTPKFFPNCTLLKPDAVVLDLEDSVAPEAKLAARVLVRRALATLDFGETEVLVRINSGELGGADLEVMADMGVHGFLIPKVESPETLIQIGATLDESGSESLLIPLIESALGVERLFEICTASPRIVAASLGLEDYLTNIGAMRTASQLESAYAQSRLINAARAAGIMPLGSVFPGVDDDQPLRAYARDCRMRGYEGIGCIHPLQLNIVHEEFQPSLIESAYAQKVVNAFESAQGAHVGAILVEGQMVDKPVYERAKRLLAQGEAEQ
jgi:citrate lyase subunit beta/citryl-CoA lyase